MSQINAKPDGYFVTGLYIFLYRHTHTAQAHKITNKVFLILNTKPVNSKEAWTYCSNWNPLFIPQLPLIWEKHGMKGQERDKLDQNVPGDISSEKLQLLFAFVRSVPYHFLKKECFPVSLNYTKLRSVLTSLQSIEFSHCYHQEQNPAKVNIQLDIYWSEPGRNVWFAKYHLILFLELCLHTVIDSLK